MEQYIKEVKDLQFRKEKLLEQAKKMETLLSGKYVHYYEFMEDENGSYSEEKVWEMVEELLEALRKYDAYFLREEEGWDEEDAIDFALTEDDEIFLKSFMYCVLRWGYSGIGICDSYAGKGNFEDFIEMEKKLPSNRRLTEEQLLYEEMYECPGSDLFSVFDDVYKKVMGTSVSELADAEVLERMKKQYEAEIREIEEGWETYNQLILDAYGGEMSLEEIEKYENEQFMMSFEPDEMSLIENKVYEWEEKAIQCFQNKEIFAEQYKIFRRYFFKVDEYTLSRMDYTIEGMLDIYLYQHNLSKFLDDELFFKTFAMLRKTTNYVQQYLPEEVK